MASTIAAALGTEQQACSGHGRSCRRSFVRSLRSLVAVPEHSSDNERDTCKKKTPLGSVKHVPHIGSLSQGLRPLACASEGRRQRQLVRYLLARSGP